MTSDVTEFSERLRELFNATGWDVAELVRRTGLSRGAVSRHLNGKADPHYPLKVVYAQVLGVPVDAMLKRSPADAPLTLSPELSGRIRAFAALEKADPADWLESLVMETVSDRLPPEKMAPPVYTNLDTGRQMEITPPRRPKARKQAKRK